MCAKNDESAPSMTKHLRKNVVAVTGLEEVVFDIIGESTIKEVLINALELALQSIAAEA